jgi:hypothetical protein
VAKLRAVQASSTSTAGASDNDANDDDDDDDEADGPKTKSRTVAAKKSKTKERKGRASTTTDVSPTPKLTDSAGGVVERLQKAAVQRRNSRELDTVTSASTSTSTTTTTTTATPASNALTAVLAAAAGEGTRSRSATSDKVKIARVHVSTGVRVCVTDCVHTAVRVCGVCADGRACSPSATLTARTTAARRRTAMTRACSDVTPSLAVRDGVVGVTCAHCALTHTLSRTHVGGDAKPVGRAPKPQTPGSKASSGTSSTKASSSKASAAGNESLLSHMEEESELLSARSELTSKIASIESKWEGRAKVRVRTLARVSQCA